jgi:hypothetical protein
MLYIMDSYLLKRQLGAITQPLRMEHHQTQINVVESEGKTSAQLGPSTLKALSPKQDDKQSMLSEKRYLAYISG